jgi:hypothetical protein
MAAPAFVFRQTPGSPADQDGSAGSLNQLILAELRVISLLLAQQSPGVVNPDDLDNLRADPSILNQRMS